jgi:hypothetical protein
MQSATQIAKGVGLRKRELEFADEVRKFLELAHHNIYVWCDFLGYELIDRDFHCKNGTGIFIRTKKKAYIGIRKDLPYKQKIVCIAHEMFHDRFHPECIAFRVMNTVQTNINEGKAELFGTLVLYPSLTDFESEEDFYSLSGLAKVSADIRLHYYRKTGQ